MGGTDRPANINWGRQCVEDRKHTRLSDARVPRASVFASISSIIAGADGDPSTVDSEPTIVPCETVEPSAHNQPNV